MKFKDGDLVLCTVKKIDKTTIFLDIEDDGEGSLVFSEVAAGRIRNIRDYVSPNKKIVCKILKIENNHAELSLRRVTAKERESVLERYKKEKSLVKMLETLTKNSGPIIEKIKSNTDFVSFFEEARENPKLLAKYFPKEEADKLVKILGEKSEKEKEIKKLFKLTTLASSGINDIREILGNSSSEIRYLGSSRFSITAKAKDFKEANRIISSILEEIKAKAKAKHAHFEIIEK